MHGLLRVAVTLAILAAIGFAGYALLRNRPQDLPWTPLDLGQPVGMFTARKIVALGDDFPQCQALLDRAGVRYTALPPRGSGQCAYTDGVRYLDGGARSIDYRPGGLGVACPVAAALAVWEWQVVQPAAQRHFGTGISRVEHFGSFSCRRVYGRDAGAWGEHATADAIDIAGFVLADGRRVTVVGDWDGSGSDGAAKAAFLREVRDGACGVFATVLSPDYNAAHRDHFHMDQANRGAMGWRACR